MSILTEKLAEYLIVKGIKVEIKTDFKHWIKIIEAIDEENPNFIELFLDTVEYFEEEPDFEGLMEALEGFLVFGDYFYTKETGKQPSQPVFSFSLDGGLIYSAFYQQYGIDLLEENVHWHKFLTLFRGITEATLFRQVVNLRSEGEKSEQGSAKSFWQLPYKKSDQQLLQRVGENLRGGANE